MNLPIELKTRIYDHIGTVQAHLAELPADEKREILQSLEAHIYDVLEARTGGNPTIEQLEAVLAEMDPPESYGTGKPAAPAPRETGDPSRKPKRSGMGCLVAVLLFIAVPLVFYTCAREWTRTTDAVVAIDPAGLIGSWASIDFVPKINMFDPARTNWRGELQLKGITFLENGKTTKPWWIWKNNQLIHQGDQTEAELSIKTFRGVDYLFLEWISGDVLNKGMPPKYYVLKRGEYTDQD